MILKPRSTVLNPRMLIYRRFTGLESSFNLKTIYKTMADNKFWLFDGETKQFSEINSENIPQNATIVSVTSQTSVFEYYSTYYYYNNGQWTSTTTLPQGITPLSATFNNIGKYQMNKYYYVGSMDYMIRGSIEGTTTQPIKGNIIPLTSMNIKFFNDSIKLSKSDLVVIDKHLYSVENVETVQKRMPRIFNIYFATLNNIL